MTNQEQERQIVDVVVSAALEKNYLISVRNGGATDELTGSSNKEEILNEMFATDHDVLYFYTSDKPLDCIGTILFVYGNMPYEVIADYVDNDLMEELVNSASELTQEPK